MTKSWQDYRRVTTRLIRENKLGNGYLSIYLRQSGAVDVGIPFVAFNACAIFQV
jgi:hypothetical protein